jgi:hypothetical protein
VVIAQAKDVHGLVSDWSDGLTVVVSIGNNEPNKPTLTGKIKGKAGNSYTYYATSTDPDDDQLEYWFDWDDGQNSGWFGFFDSGDTCEKSHIWTAQGAYSIKVKARDIHGLESVWSDPLSISMPKSKSYNDRQFLGFLQSILERFPFLAHLLQPVFTRLLYLR